jgi:nucleoside-triphosphatase THEP1
LSDLDDLRLPAPDERGAVILVSGWRQVGKTTLLLAVREAAIHAGRSVGGFLSVARFENGTKTGIDLLDAASGGAIPLATVGGDGAIRTGHYTFNPAALRAGLRYAESGSPAEVFFVDELGPLELQRGAGWVAVIPILAARGYGVAFVVVRPELLDLLREHLGLPPDSPVITVDESNRGELAEILTRWLTD